MRQTVPLNFGLAVWSTYLQTTTTTTNLKAQMYTRKYSMERAFEEGLLSGDWKK